MRGHTRGTRANTCAACTRRACATHVARTHTRAACKARMRHARSTHAARMQHAHSTQARIRHASSTHAARMRNERGTHATRTRHKRVTHAARREQTTKRMRFSDLLCFGRCGTAGLHESWMSSRLACIPRHPMTCARWLNLQYECVCWLFAAGC